jgi:hypothetical protein
MTETRSTTARQVAQAAGELPQQNADTPRAVTVVLDGQALAITLGAALAPPERKPERRWPIASSFKS